MVAPAAKGLLKLGLKSVQDEALEKLAAQGKNVHPDRLESELLRRGVTKTEINASEIKDVARDVPLEGPSVALTKKGNIKAADLPKLQRRDTNGAKDIFEVREVPDPVYKRYTAAEPRTMSGQHKEKLYTSNTPKLDNTEGTSHWRDSEGYQFHTRVTEYEYEEANKKLNEILATAGKSARAVDPLNLKAFKVVHEIQSDVLNARLRKQGFEVSQTTTFDDVMQIAMDPEAYRSDQAHEFFDAFVPAFEKYISRNPGLKLGKDYNAWKATDDVEPDVLGSELADFLSEVRHDQGEVEKVFSAVLKENPSLYRSGKVEPLPYNFRLEGLKRELIDSAEKGQSELWVPIGKKGDALTSEMARGETVQKQYEGPVRDTMRKLANRINGRFAEEGGYAKIIIPTQEEYVAKEVAKAEKSVKNLSPEKKAAALDKVRKMAAATAASGLGLSLYAQENEQGQMPGDIALQMLQEGERPSDIRLAMKDMYTPEQIDEAMWHAFQPQVKEMQAEGENEADILTAAKMAGVVSENFRTPAQDSAEAETAAETAAEGGQEEPGMLDKVGQFFSDRLNKGAEAAGAYQQQVARQDMPKSDYKPSLNWNSPQEIHDALQRMNTSYSKDWTAIKGLWNAEAKKQAAIDKQSNNAFILQGLQQNGIQARVLENGELAYTDPETGEEKPFEQNMLEALLTWADENKGEIMGGITGARVGLQVPGGPWVKAGAVAAGSAIGAGFGIGADHLTMAARANTQIDIALMANQMKEAAILDSVVGVTMSTAFKGAQATHKLYKGVLKAWDVFVHNREGAMKAFKEFTDLDDSQISALIAKWESITGQEAAGHRVEQATRAYIETTPGGEKFMRPALRTSKTGGSRMLSQINARARALQDEAGKLTNDNVSSAITYKLEKYKGDVKQSYESVKQLGVQAMADTPYKWDFDKVAGVQVFEGMYTKITNPAKAQEFRRYIDKLRAIGTEEAQAAAGKVDFMSTPAGLQKVDPRTVDPEIFSPVRRFENLLELRATINEFKRNKNFADVFIKAPAVEKIMQNIDAEIASAAKTHMHNGDNWLKLWREQLTEYGKMKELESNVLYKALTTPRLDHDKAIRALSTYITNLDGTFMEVLGKLPPKTRTSVEGAVIKHLVNKNLAGTEGGKQAIDFIALQKDLEHVAFTSEGNRKLKRLINEMASVYKNDPAILKTLHQGPNIAESSTMATTVQGKAKMRIVKEVYDHLKSMIPFLPEGRRRALVKLTKSILDNPLQVKQVDQLLKELPPDPELKTLFKEYSLQFAKYGEKEKYAARPIYRVAPPGKADMVVPGKYGNVLVYGLDEAAAKTAVKGSDARVSTREVPPRMIATVENAAQILGKEVMPEDLLDPVKQAEIYQTLQHHDFLGIAVEDKVLIFP